jgi:NAD(P)-dependent dehydrogenase (short-subunit alcohol dehydrogenase family)
MMAFRGRVALVTGAASGIGQLAAQRLASAGAQVAALDVNEAGLKETAGDRASVRTYRCDVSDHRAVETLVEQVESELGPIDRVVHAAALAPTGLLLDQDVDVIRRLMEVNYCGTVNVAKATLPGMLARRSGDLIIFSSIAGWLPTPHFGAYNATKFAVVAFSEVLYHENRGKGVRMVCVCPPKVQTPMLDQATSNPKTLEGAPALQPGEVLDAIEDALERGQFWAFPGRGTRWIWRLRRFLPGLIWRRLHRIEGI